MYSSQFTIINKLIAKSQILNYTHLNSKQNLDHIPYAMALVEGRNIKPVSYTHLDVYKRQKLTQSSFEEQ